MKLQEFKNLIREGVRRVMEAPDQAFVYVNGKKKQASAYLEILDM